METVQSEIASESPGILDVFRDGALRLVEISNKGRLIPIYALLPSTIAYGVTKYLFTLIVRGITSRIMHIRHKHRQEYMVKSIRENLICVIYVYSDMYKKKRFFFLFLCF